MSAQLRIANLIILLSLCTCQYYPRENIYPHRKPPQDRTSSKTVHTPYGAIRGKVVNFEGIQVSQFFGIPYAFPPVRKLRFKKPKPLPWKKARFISALKKGPSCPQTTYYFDKLRNNRDLRFSEDCLHLNIWSTSVDYGKLPVLVFIHGGFFSHGGSESSTLDMTYLSSRGIVCVSFNYRLNALGFLYAGVKEAGGNMGLYDQQLALQWVKKHISYFGGDPDQMTVMGHGAGAIAASYHLLNKVSRKLFSRVILHSGNPYSMMSLNQASVAFNRANIIARRLGCISGGSDLRRAPLHVLYCLLKKDPAQLAKAAEFDFTRGELSLMPVIESEQFLKRSPEDLLYEIGQVEGVEILMGVTRNEYAASLYYTGYFEAEEEILPGDVKYLVGLFYGTFFKANALPVLKYYFRDYRNASDLFKLGGHAISDGILVCPGNEFAEEISALGAKVYYYSFDHESSFSNNLFGVSNSEDILYSLGSLRGPAANKLQPSSEDLEFADEMVEIITSFVFYGRPSSPRVDNWPAYTAANPVCVSLKASNISFAYGPRLEECNFWTYFWNNYDAAVGQKYTHVILG